MITPELESHIKELFLSAPIDIYSEEDDNLNVSALELVNPRLAKYSKYYYEKEEVIEETSRYIGSANVFIAASIVCLEITNKKYLSDLTEEQSLIFGNTWRSLIDKLIKEKFIREIQPVAHSKIKLVVNNEGLPQ